MALSDDARNRLFIAVTDQTVADEICDAIDTGQEGTVDVSVEELAGTDTGEGAALIGVEDSGGLLTATNVEAALAELARHVPLTLADPGTAAAIPVTRSAHVAFTIAGTETNTLAIPTFLGQTLILTCGVYTSGTRAVTAAQALNQAGNTIMTFGAVRDNCMLRAITVGGALRWQVVHNDGVALSP